MVPMRGGVRTWLSSLILRGDVKAFIERTRERLTSLDLPVVITDVYGIRSILAPWDRRGLDETFSREFHRKEFKALARVIRPGDVVFDVGANIGLVSVYMHRLCKPNGSLYAFEPVEDTFWMLMETLALNRCVSVHPFHLAISDRRGKLTMNIFDRQHSEFNSLGRPAMPGLDGKKVRPSTVQKVPTDTLDHFCESQGVERIDFLKVDVEGFEKQVFEGGRELLRNRRIKSISFEISQDPLRGAGTKPCEVFGALETVGYRSFRYNEVNDSFEGPVNDSSEYYDIFFASYDDFPGLPSVAGKL